MMARERAERAQRLLQALWDAPGARSRPDAPRVVFTFNLASPEGLPLRQQGCRGSGRDRALGATDRDVPRQAAAVGEATTRVVAASKEKRHVFLWPGSLPWRLSPRTRRLSRVIGSPECLTGRIAVMQEAIRERLARPQEERKCVMRTS